MASPSFGRLWDLHSGPFKEILKGMLGRQEKVALHFASPRMRKEYPWKKLFVEELDDCIEHEVFVDPGWVATPEMWNLLSKRMTKFACPTAAYFGRLDCLKWARENGCPGGRTNCLVCGRGRTPELPQVVACPWTPGEFIDVHASGEWWSPGVPEVGARTWVPVGYLDVREDGDTRVFGVPEVAAGEWMPMG
jgi:hypothetical protein